MMLLAGLSKILSISPPVKGMVTNDPELAENIRKVAGHGFKNLQAKEGRVRLREDVFQDPNYLRHDLLGWNYRMSEFTAAIALAQLEKADNIVNLRRFNAFEFIRTVGKNSLLSFPVLEENETHDFYTLPVIFNPEFSDITWQDFKVKI